MRRSCCIPGPGTYLPALFALLGLLAGTGASAQSFNIGAPPLVESCTGSFFDSGGPDGPYSNNEDLVTTMCPFGGEGGGPLTSVEFLVWDVAPGNGDQLFIHDGSSTADPILATGDGDNSLEGLTFTATNVGGCLTFRWVSDAAGTAPGWVASITTAPLPGLPNAIEVCSSDAPFDLIGALGGDPAPGGQWSNPLGDPHGSSYDPATDPGGTFTYTVTGPAPCPALSATLEIDRTEAPVAGTNATTTLCSNNAPVELVGLLGGSPDPGGTWTGPGDTPHGSTFDPATDTPGVYTYTVAGVPPCADASATVTISVNTAPDAGADASIDVCSLDPAFNLLDQLGGTPDAGGTWVGPDAQPMNGVFNPATSQPGIHTYTVVGASPCVAASATVEVGVVQAPDPGISRSIAVCSNDAPFAMVERLNGTPQPGGTWTAPGGGSFGPTFDPSVHAGGAYTYTVAGTAPCLDRSATLTITVRPAPNAGESATIVLCSTDGSVQLLDELGGTPDGNGVWTAPGGGASNGIFLPGSSLPGEYLYTVTGLSPCVPATATVTVEVNNAPVAGSNRTVAVCSDQSPFALVDSLGGSPDTGGIWLGPGAIPHGSTFDPASDTPGAYTYIVAGEAPCADASATVTVNVSLAPDAGESASIVLCSTDGATNLFALLGGSPQATGSWTDPLGDAHSGTFQPASGIPGTYTYTVPGPGPCDDAVATVEVVVNQAPDAGSNGSITVCSDGPAVELFEIGRAHV